MEILTVKELKNILYLNVYIRPIFKQENIFESPVRIFFESCVRNYLESRVKTFFEFIVKSFFVCRVKTFFETCMRIFFESRLRIFFECRVRTLFSLTFCVPTRGSKIFDSFLVKIATTSHKISEKINNLQP